MTSYLYSQAESVEHDEHKHDVLKPSGVHHIPELVLVWILWDVPPQWASLKSVLHTLTLQGNIQKRASHSSLEQIETKHTFFLKLLILT